jgi:hypothetical protein
MFSIVPSFLARACPALFGGRNQVHENNTNARGHEVKAEGGRESKTLNGKA